MLTTVPVPVRPQRTHLLHAITDRNDRSIGVTVSVNRMPVRSAQSAVAFVSAEYRTRGPMEPSSAIGAVGCATETCCVQTCEPLTPIVDQSDQLITQQPVYAKTRTMTPRSLLRLPRNLTPMRFLTLAVSPLTFSNLNYSK